MFDSNNNKTFRDLQELMARKLGLISEQNLKSNLKGNSSSRRNISSNRPFNGLSDFTSSHNSTEEFKYGPSSNAAASTGSSLKDKSAQSSTTNASDEIGRKFREDSAKRKENEARRNKEDVDRRAEWEQRNPHDAEVYKAREEQEKAADDIKQAEYVKKYNASKDRRGAWHSDPANHKKAIDWEASNPNPGKKKWYFGQNQDQQKWDEDRKAAGIELDPSEIDPDVGHDPKLNIKRDMAYGQDKPWSPVDPNQPYNRKHNIR